MDINLPILLENIGKKGRLLLHSMRKVDYC